MDMAVLAQGHITAVIYSPVCKAHAMHHAVINSMSVYLQFQEGPLLLDSLLKTLLLTSFFIIVFPWLYWCAEGSNNNAESSLTQVNMFGL